MGDGSQQMRAVWWWADRWKCSSAFSLSIEERGLYREMLDASWLAGAVLPNDHKRIIRMIGATAEEWGRAWPAVSAYWVVSPDGLTITNETQAGIYAESEQLAGKRSASARTAAVARWTPGAPRMPDACAADAPRMRDACSTHVPRNAISMPSISVSIPVYDSIPVPVSEHPHIAPAALVTADAATENGSSPAVGTQSSERAADAPAPTDRPTRKRRASPTVTDGSQSHHEADEVLEIIDAWNAVRTEFMPPVTLPLPPRSAVRKAIIVALKRDMADVWRVRFETISVNRRWNGTSEGDSYDFAADIIWALGPRNAAKVDARTGHRSPAKRPTTPQSCAEALFAAAAESERREQSQRAEYTSADEGTF